MSKKKEFVNWYMNFVETFDCQQTVCKPNKWFDAVNETKKNIRKAIGNKTKYTYNVDVAKVKYKPIRTESHTDLMCSLKHWVEESSISELFKDGILLPKYKNTKTTRYINRVLDKADCRENVKNQLVQFANELIKNTYPSPDNLQVQVNTNPEAFIMLGNYGVDKGSCFSQQYGDEYLTRCKYYLGQTDDTFVVIVYKDKEVVGRCIGILETNMVHLFNYYTKHISLAQMYVCMQHVATKLLKKTVYPHAGILYDTEDVIYINDRPLTYTTSKKEPFNVDISPNMRFDTILETLVLC